MGVKFAISIYFSVVLFWNLAIYFVLKQPLLTTVELNVKPVNLLFNCIYLSKQLQIGNLKIESIFFLVMIKQLRERVT